MNVNSIKKGINFLISTVLIILILLIVFFIVSSKLSGGGPKVFGKELLTVLSGSMEPDIKTGSIIAITPAENPDSYKVGDVITFRSNDNPNILITHRIMDVQTIDSNIHYVTKGDNNDANDITPVPSMNVVGKYADFTIPFLGYILDFVKSKIGTVLMVIVPGVLFIVYAVVSVWKAIANMEDPKTETSDNPKV
ncbi:Signal peptidase I W [Bacillus sp. THAF10]|nr:Signal peptidase I W [Bacillus sp. THAF10]